MLEQHQIDLLNAPLDESTVRQRAGAGSNQLSYVPGWQVIETCNRIFGYGQWGQEVVRSGYTEVPVPHFWAVVRLTVAGCLPHEDEGCEFLKGTKSEHVELARKAAVTDALRRAARHYGDQFGNKLYDKDTAPGAAGGAGARAQAIDQAALAAMSLVAKRAEISVRFGHHPDALAKFRAAVGNPRATAANVSPDKVDDILERLRALDLGVMEAIVHRIDVVRAALPAGQQPSEEQVQELGACLDLGHALGLAMPARQTKPAAWPAAIKALLARIAQEQRALGGEGESQAA